MSDQIVRVVNDIKMTDSQFMESHQSVWMSRWKRTSCNSKREAHDGSPNTLRKMELDYTMGDDNCADKLKVPRSVKRQGTFEIVNQSLRMSSESLRKEGIEYQDLPMLPPANCESGLLFKLGQVTDDVELSEGSSVYNCNRVEAVTCEAEIQLPGILASKDILFKKYKRRDEGTSKNPPKWTQSHSSAKDSTFAVSKSLWESFVKPSSVAVPFIFEHKQSQFDEGKTLVPLFIGRSCRSAIISSNQLIDANLRLGKHEYQHNHKVDSHSQPRNSVTVCFMESNTSSLSDPPSMSNHHLSAHREWFKKMYNFSGSQQKMSKCTQDMETMRICSAVDSVVDPVGGCPRFCQATHSQLITNLENNLSRSTRISGDTRCDLCNLSPFYGQGKRGLKIQSPMNFTNAEGKGKYVKDSEVAAKNESSVEEKDPLSGAVSSTPSKKAIYMDYNSHRQASVASSKQGAAKRPNTKLPDITVDLSPLPASVPSSETGDPLCPVANPGNRCVKRLKLSSSHSTAQGTKSSSKDEPSIQEELNKNFVTLCGSAVICSEPTLTKAQGNDQYFSVDPPEKDQELLLSHAWIKRWRHNGSSRTKNEPSTVVFSDPQSSKLTLKGLRNERFPSIAAAALMGRAMSCFQPCQLQKRGCLTVWNSRAL